MLKGRGGYGWSGLWVMVLLSPVLLGFVGRQRSPVFRSGVARFLGCSDWWWVWWRSAWITMRSWQRRAWWKWGWIPMGFAMEFWWGKSDRLDFGWILDSAWLDSGSSRFCIFFFFCCDAGFFFFFFLIWVFVLGGFWWAVGSGGMVGMVKARWWWLGTGGTVIEVEGRWRRKLGKNKKGKKKFIV